MKLINGTWQERFDVLFTVAALFAFGGFAGSVLEGYSTQLAANGVFGIDAALCSAVVAGVLGCLKSA